MIESGDHTTDLSLLVMSCDRFRPVWDIFYPLLRRYWPEYSGSIYHYSETLQCAEDGVISLQSGYDRKASNWSDGLLYSLEKIHTPYIILMLEDFFLNRPVKDDQVRERLKFMKSRNTIGCHRLVPIPPAESAEDGVFGKVLPGEGYRISTQVAIWDRHYLMKVCRTGETAWEFERNGTIRSEEMEEEVWSPLPQPYEERVMTHINGVIRGKLSRQALRFLNMEDLKVDPKIPVNNSLEEWYWFGAPDIARKGLDYINKNVHPILWRENL